MLENSTASSTAGISSIISLFILDRGCKKACSEKCLKQRLKAVNPFDLGYLVVLTHVIVPWSLMSFAKTPIATYFCAILASIKSNRVSLCGFVVLILGANELNHV